MSSEPPVDRRQFFRDSLRHLFKPLAEAAHPIEQALKKLETFDQLSSPRPAVQGRVYLRPPGSLPEQQFKETCSRCAKCVEVCPADAIKLDPNQAGGAPFIVASESPCVVCTGLHCMHNCPSGAIQFTPINDIEMGLAVWHEHACVRTRGQDCTKCLDTCPLGSAAIVLRDGKIDVIKEGCIGCGVCEFYCPTSPKSISVVPRSAI